MSQNQPWPEERAGVYLVTEKLWHGEPTPKCKPLYVGTNTKNPTRFLQRFGELVKDMLGFFGEVAGNHPGGWKIYRYCEEKQLHPLDLYVGWINGITCTRCGENYYYDRLKPTINARRSSRCLVHKI